MSSVAPPPVTLCSIADLRWAAELICREGDPRGTRVAAAIAAVLDGADPRRALGLTSAAGCRSAVTKDRIARRDALIRSLAARHFKGMTTSEQARRICAAGAAYWRRAAALDRGRATMPEGYAGSPRQFLFELTQLADVMPAERTIRAILTHPDTSAINNVQPIGLAAS